MASTRSHEVRDYRFANQALALRERAGLTQPELAELLGVSKRAIQTWEAGESFPGTERLRQLIAFYLARGVLAAGREEAEAAALWAGARGSAARRLVPFEPTWFASLRELTGATLPSVPAAPFPAAPVPPKAEEVPSRQHHLGEAPDAGICYGRAEEEATLTRWLLIDRCRLVGVLGMGGIGKTLLAARVARAVAPEFAVVYWRGLRNAPPVEEWVAGAIGALSAAHALPPDGFAARLTLLLELLQTRRALLVLDNLETVLVPGASVARYREGYAGYGEVLRQLAESSHQGCLLVTGREAPPELALLGGPAPARTLRLGGLAPEAGRALLRERGLAGDAAAWEGLVAHYGGNPLALSVVSETIGVVFGSDIATFLAQGAGVFGGIRQLLDEQVERLASLEGSVLTWLAVEREPVGFAELVADLGPGVARSEVVEAVEALARRSLLERSGQGAFTLHPVVLEYATTRLVVAVAEEILAGVPALLVSQALIKAQAKDYVRRSQERLIAQPLLERLGAQSGAHPVDRRLRALLEAWRGQTPAEQGYGPGNVVNLLRLLQGDLRGLDLSQLVIRQAYLAGVGAQDARLTGAHLAEAVLGEAFANPMAVALSADGAFLAAGLPTGELRLWWVADRTLLLAVHGHNGPVVGIALSRDGALVASGSVDGPVRLWEAGSGRLLATLQGHTGGAWAVAFSGDGRLVAGGGHDGMVRLWEAPSGRLLVTMQGHTGLVRGVALSGDGQLVASGGADGTVRLWAVGSGQAPATLEGHTGPVMGVALSGDGRLVASGSMDGTVRLWEIPSGQPPAILQGHTGGVWSVALSGDGRLVASGSVDGTVRLWSTTPTSGYPVPGSGRLLATLMGHTGVIWRVALSGDGLLLASGGQDGTVRLWEAGSRQLLATLQGYTGAVWSVALSGDGRLLAGGSLDGSVRLWEVESGRLLATLLGHTGGVYGVALSGDGRLVASGSLDGTVRLWATQEVPGCGRAVATLLGHTGAVHGVALSGDSRLLASGSLDGTVRLWEAGSGRLLATLQGPTGAVHGVALSGDGRLVAGGSLDGTVRLWDAETRQLLATLQGPTGGVRGVALSGDDRLVAAGSDDGTVWLWDVGSGQSLATLHGHTGGVWDVALSGDGRLVASGGQDGTVRLWEIPSGQPLATLQGHTGLVRGVTLSGDGRLVAGGGYDGTVRLWEGGSGACLHTLRTDRRYERLDITDLTGVNEAQRAALRALGAIEQAQWPSNAPTRVG